MRKTFIVSFFLVVVGISGCTPTGEGIARRSDRVSVNVSDTVLTGQEDALPSIDPQTEAIIRKFGPAIKMYSARYGFDWRLVLAIMKQESRFSHQAESRRGAAGLMQIMPGTEEEVARMLAIDDLSHPENNIRGGVFYLRKLYDLFDGGDEADRLKITLAAYNAGPSRIFDAQDLAVYLQEQPLRWQPVRDALPLLSKRFYTLHRDVWAGGRPRAGWFGGAKETTHYVDAVIAYYDEYREILN
jgi:membrane-bound lytic murein transglycosylase F